MKPVHFLFSLLLLTACGSEPVKEDIPVQEAVMPQKGEVPIPGTRVFLVPPPNFVAATSFSGFQKGDDALLNVMDLKGGNFFTNAASFSREAFESRGVKVFDYKEMKISGYPAKFMEVQGDAATTAINLVFGDSTFSTMVTAVYQTGDKATQQDMIRSLNSIRYDKKRNVDPFESARFTFDENASGFKFYQNNANLYIYTPGGQALETNSDLPFAIVLQVPKDRETTPESLAVMIMQKAGEYGFTDLKQQSAGALRLNGQNAFEVELQGRMEDRKGLIYICAVANDEVAVVLQGIAKEDTQTALAAYKKLMHAVRLM